MTSIKFCWSIRKIRTTSHAELLVFKRLIDQLELLTSLKSQEFIKLHGHTLKVLFFALLIKSLMGTKLMDSFEGGLNDDRFMRKIIILTRKLEKTVLEAIRAFDESDLTGNEKDRKKLGKLW